MRHRFHLAQRRVKNKKVKKNQTHWQSLDIALAKKKSFQENVCVCELKSFSYRDNESGGGKKRQLKSLKYQRNASEERECTLQSGSRELHWLEMIKVRYCTCCNSFWLARWMPEKGNRALSGAWWRKKENAGLNVYKLPSGSETHPAHYYTPSQWHRANGGRVLLCSPLTIM